MANTYTQIFIHVVFAVKVRQNLIPMEKKEELNKYITGIIKNKGHKLLKMNCMVDHIHILIGLEPNESLSVLMKEVKRFSSLYINQNNWVKGKFEWQSGYGAFSYSKSQVPTICRYIEKQEMHHHKKTFREEFVEMLEKFEVEYETRYIFEDV